MTTLEKLSQILLLCPDDRAQVHLNRDVIIEAKAEIERLEKQNTLLKSALIHIADERSEVSGEDRIERAVRFAKEALQQCK